MTNSNVPQGTETLAVIQRNPTDALVAMGGDAPSVEGGPADESNTYSYLKSHIPGASSLTDAQFRQALVSVFGVDTKGRLNVEGFQVPPVLIEDDHFYFHVLGAEVNPDIGLIADPTPPFGLYRANSTKLALSGVPLMRQDTATGIFRSVFLSDTRKINDIEVPFGEVTSPLSTACLQCLSSSALECVTHSDDG